ncbi:hypothetical protein MN032_01515 [Agromyces atrinae]|uniref:MFS transporter n=1 Tax=Agromyces atrinae TaxID=592376 RepID=UPI001F5784EC|nr:MFS transporter [Agromyces atrinae]MCI2956355.1 hypothetical protein [Agromyces atrinae]
MTTPSYSSVLRAPGIARAFVPSIIGRLSLATSGLALVLLLERSTGSFAVAGAVTAALGIANVVATPWRARLIDRRGQALVLSLLGAVHAASLVAFAVLTDAALPALLVLGVIAGVSAPPFGATMRVVWATALDAGGSRTRGFSLDAVAEEVTFAVGPLLAAVLAAVLDPVASLLASAAFVALGTAAFVTSRLSREQVGSHRVSVDGPAAVTPMRSRGFPLIVVAMTAPGIILGCIEIAAPAIAAGASSTVLSGVLLALFAGASAIGGLVYGRLRVRATFERQLLVIVAVLLVVSAATGLIGGPLAALIGFALAGLFLAPVLIVGYLAADARTDPRARTEASSWINTAVNFGAAIGALVFGALTDGTGPGVALVWTVAGAGVVLVGCGPWLVQGRGEG